MTLPIRHRRRVVLAAGATGLALAAGLFVADRALASRAEHRLATRLQSVVDLSSPPQVELSGLAPGLDAVRGEVGEVTVTVRDVAPRRRPDGVRVSTATMTLKGVSGERGKGMHAEHAEVAATVGWDQLGTRLGRPAKDDASGGSGGDDNGGGDQDGDAKDGAKGALGGGLAGTTLGYGGDGLVAAQRTASVLGQEVPVTVFLRPVLAEGRLTFTPVEVEVLGTRRSGERLLQRLGATGNLSRSLPKAPAGLQFTGVEATEAGLVVHLAGDDVRLDREGLARP